MKKILLTILAMTILSNTALAECDFSTGITQSGSNYIYTKECHIKVGEMKRDNDIFTEQNEKLTKALTLKDLTINTADQRADMWKTATLKLEDRMVTIDQMEKKNQLLMFGLGVLTAIGAGYAAAKLAGR